VSPDVSFLGTGGSEAFAGRSSVHRLRFRRALRRLFSLDLLLCAHFWAPRLCHFLSAVLLKAPPETPSFQGRPQIAAYSILKLRLEHSKIWGLQGCRPCRLQPCSTPGLKSSNRRLRME